MSFVNSVFVSSTYDDLKEERSAVADALVSCGCLPVGMENFGANPMNKIVHLKNAIQMCDLYVLILAGRYGTLIPEGIIFDNNMNIPKGYRMSYTEYEFRQAKCFNKQIFVFRYHDYKDLPKEKREDNAENMKRLEDFITYVNDSGENHDFFNNVAELSQAVQISFGNYRVKADEESICKGTFVSFIPALRCREETHPFKSDEWHFQANGSNIYGTVKRLLPTLNERNWQFNGLTLENEIHLAFIANDHYKRAGSVILRKSVTPEGMLDGSYYQFSKTDDDGNLMPTAISLRKVDSLRKQEYALLDWDNTLREGFLLFSWIDFLHEKGHVTDSLFAEIDSLKSGYAERKLSYKDLAELSAEKYAILIAGKDPQIINSLAQKFVSSDFRNLYPYCADLFKLLEEKNVYTIVISGSPKLLIDLYRIYFHIDDIYALEPGIKNPFINDGVCNYGGDKSQIVKYIRAFFGGKNPLIAVGDSTSDFPMLDCAKHKFLVKSGNETVEETKDYVVIKPKSKTADIIAIFNKIFENGAQNKIDNPDIR